MRENTEQPLRQLSSSSTSLLENPPQNYMSSSDNPLVPSTSVAGAGHPYSDDTLSEAQNALKSPVGLDPNDVTYLSLIPLLASH